MRRKLQRSVGVVATAALLAGGSGWGQGGGTTPPGSPARLSTHALSITPRETHAWRAATYTTSAGESVHIEISDGYAPDAVSGQTWAEFFGSLVHGSELGTVTIRIAPPAEVAATCGEDALGCYSGGLLVVPGEQSGGIAPDEIARHEYGHHVAASRLNPPWTGASYGPKRWSTAEGICARANEGTAFPDDYSHYTLSPSEAFAETYRVLNDRRAGIAGLTWGLVDDSFIPNDGVLRAVEQDVLSPWLAPTTRVLVGRFVEKGKRRWVYAFPTPLDGVVSAELRIPAGRTDTLDLLDAQGRLVARGLWAGTAVRRLTFVDCGQRRLSVRVTLGGPPGRFAVSLSRP